MGLAPQQMKPGGGLGLPKSPIGGPSGPGGSPMVAPGTGAGMQARSRQTISKVIDQLMEAGATFEKGSKEFGTLSRVISMLNGLAKPAAPEASKQPLPVPATTPGPGGAPPAGLPSPTGGPMGGMGIAPGGPGEM